MCTTIDKMARTKLRSTHSRLSTSVSVLAPPTNPHGGPIFYTTNNRLLLSGLGSLQVYMFIDRSADIVATAALCDYCEREVMQSS